MYFSGNTDQLLSEIMRIKKKEYARFNPSRKIHDKNLVWFADLYYKKLVSLEVEKKPNKYRAVSLILAWEEC